MKRGPQQLKLFVGKGAVLRDTAALASGKLPGATDEAFLFSYVFGQDTLLSGEIVFKLWIAADADARVSYAVRLERTSTALRPAQLEARVQLPCLTTVEPETSFTARTQAVSLRILTVPSHFAEGENLLLSLQLRGEQGGVGPAVAILFGGNHPTHLTLALGKNLVTAA